MSNVIEQIDLSNVKFPDVMDLRTAAIYSGFSDQYLRSKARKEEIPSTKGENGQWLFKRADLDAFKNRPRATGGPRGDGKAYIIRIKHADYAKVEAALKQFSIAIEPRYKKPAKKKEAPAAPAKK